MITQPVEMQTKANYQRNLEKLPIATKWYINFTSWVSVLLFVWMGIRAISEMVTAFPVLVKSGQMFVWSKAIYVIVVAASAFIQFFLIMKLRDQLIAGKDKAIPTFWYVGWLQMVIWCSKLIMLLTQPYDRSLVTFDLISVFFVFGIFIPSIIYFEKRKVLFNIEEREELLQNNKPEQLLIIEKNKWIAISIYCAVSAALVVALAIRYITIL